MSNSAKHILAVGVCMMLAFVLVGCEQPKPQAVKTVTIPDGEIDPAVWGKAYPEQYELWKKTAEPVPSRRSKYRVAANSRLRETLREAAAAEGVTPHIPPLELCGDNAAMIAAAGWHLLAAGKAGRPDEDVYSRAGG